nr:hypothetical protein [Candidatus Omnitrophota bacterium]
MSKKTLPSVVVLGMTATGLSVARSLGRKGIKVYGVDCSGKQPGMYSRYVAPILVPNPMEDEAGFVESLVTLGKQIGAQSALFCASDESVGAVSRNRDILSKYYIFNIPSDKTVEDFLDKRRSYAIAQDSGLDCPANHVINDINELESIAGAVKFPCAIKPAVSHLWRARFGGKKLIPANSREELLEIAEKTIGDYPQLMIQELIPGGDDQIYLFYAYYDKKGDLTAFSVLRKL